MRTCHPRDVLRQVAKDMNGGNDELSVTLPAHSTWRTAIQAAEAAMGDVDEKIFIMPPVATRSRRRNRETALECLKRFDERTGPLGRDYARPIRTRVELQNLESPKPPSEYTRRRLREEAKKITEEQWSDPYLTLRATLADGFLPMITGNVRLTRLDESDEDAWGKLDAADMIWDTGAHRTIITEELLSAKFREYLATSIHDPYRSGDKSSVQVDAVIAFSNGVVSLSTVAVVMPQNKMPNQLLGILFGQCACIDRLRYESIPRCIIQAKGEEIGDEFWGDIVVKEFLDGDDKVVVLPD